MTRYSVWSMLLGTSVLLSSVLAGAASGQGLQFNTHTDYTTGNNPASIAVGDFNGDGISDQAVADYGGYTVAVLLGNGNGTFRPAAGLPAFIGPGSFPPAGAGGALAVGDFNRDGKLDVAAANAGANAVVV